MSTSDCGGGAGADALDREGDFLAPLEFTHRCQQGAGARCRLRLRHAGLRRHASDGGQSQRVHTTSLDARRELGATPWVGERGAVQHARALPRHLTFSALMREARRVAVSPARFVARTRKSFPAAAPARAACAGNSRTLRARALVARQRPFPSPRRRRAAPGSRVEGTAQSGTHRPSSHSPFSRMRRRLRRRSACARSPSRRVAVGQRPRAAATQWRPACGHSAGRAYSTSLIALWAGRGGGGIR